MRTVPPGDYTLFAWKQIDRGPISIRNFFGSTKTWAKRFISKGWPVSVQLNLISTAETAP